MKHNKIFFLISFLPAIAYWYLEENYGLKIALIGGLALAVIEITLEKVVTKHIHSISKFNFYLLFALGLIALIGQEGIWFKLQPFFTGLFMGGYLLFRSYKGASLMLEMMETMGNQVPNKETLSIMERDLGIFLIFYGFFMAYVAFELTTSQWTFFKTIGFYIVALLFFVVEMISMRFRLKSRNG